MLKWLVLIGLVRIMVAACAFYKPTYGLLTCRRPTA